MMDLRKKTYGLRPEYCAVVDKTNRVVLLYEGDLNNVKFDVRAVRDMAFANNLKYILHSHRYGMGCGYSSYDLKVFESWAVALNETVLHRITDFCEVCDYYVKADGDIRGYTRGISLWESLTNMPWGVKL